MKNRIWNILRYGKYRSCRDNSPILYGYFKYLKERRGEERRGEERRGEERRECVRIFPSNLINGDINLLASQPATQLFD